MNESLVSIFDLSAPERDVAFCSLLLMDMASEGGFDRPLSAEGIHKKLRKKDKNISYAHALDALGYAVASEKFVMRKNDDMKYFYVWALSSYAPIDPMTNRSKVF